MKRIPLFMAIAACVLNSSGALGQENRQDTTRKPLKIGEKLPLGEQVAVETDTLLVEKTDGSGKKKLIIRFESGGDLSIKREGRSGGKTYVSAPKRKSKAIAGITFARVDLGFAPLLDNGSFNLSPENDFLRYRTWKTVNFGFDLLQLGYRFDEKFRMFVSAGFDWTYIRFQQNVLLNAGSGFLDPTIVEDNLEKNRLTSTYIRLPFTLEHRFGPDRGFKLAYGPIGGLLMHGSQRYRGPQGKVKVRDDFNFAKFRYGGFVRFGYNSFGLYAKYYANDIFVNSPDQEGLKNLSLGAMLFF